MEKQKSFKIYLFALLGNIFDHYDLALYGFLAPVFADLYFPSSDSITSLMKSYAMFPLFFLSRILGANFFGKIGDTKGTANSLSYTLFGMAIISFTIGCMPTYEKMGNAATFWFLLALFLQNFFASGEKIGGALYVLENTRTKKKSMVSSIYELSSIFGYLLAAFFTTIISKIGDLSVHWRYLYFFTACTALMGFFIRKTLLVKKPSDSEVFEKKFTSLLFLSIVFASSFSYGIYYVFMTFMSSWIPLVAKITYVQVMKMNMYLLILDMCLLPFFGFLSYRFGIRKMMHLALYGAAIMSFPTFYFLVDANYGQIFWIRLFWIAIGVCFSAPFYFWAFNMAFRNRYRNIALGSVIGAHIGKSAPLLSLWLYQKTSWAFSPAIVLMIFAATALFFLKIKERSFAKSNALAQEIKP